MQKAPSMPKIDRTVCSVYNRNSIRQYCQAAEEDQSFTDSEESKSLSKSEMEKALSLVGKTDSSLSVKEWKEVQDKFMELENGKVWHFEKLVMRSIVRLGYYRMGQSFFELLRSEGKLISDDIAGMFLSFCIENKELDHVFEWYDKHLHSGLTVSQFLLPVIIKGYCLSERWRESLQLLKQLPRNRTYHYVISAACQHRDLELIMNLVREIKKQVSLTC